jgi:hypothetical protein
LHRKKCYENGKKEKETKTRKRLKIDVKGKTHYIFVENTHGEYEKMYKNSDSAESYGYITFGPPHLFYDENKQRKLFSELS